MLKILTLVFLLALPAEAVKSRAVYGVLITPRTTGVPSIPYGHAGIDIGVDGTTTIFRSDGTQTPMGTVVAPLSVGRSNYKLYATDGLDFQAVSSCESFPGRVALWRNAASSNQINLRLASGTEVELGVGTAARSHASSGNPLQVSCIEIIPLQRSPFKLGEAGLWVDVSSKTLKARRPDGTDVLVSCGSGNHVNINTCGYPVCSFSTMFPGCSNPDTDGDGYSDIWETQQGIDLNCDGTIVTSERVLVGANAAIKDIYISYDWMQKDTVNFPGEAQHQPLPDSFEVFGVRGGSVGNIAGPIPRVVAAFAAHNIVLHVAPNTNAAGAVTSPLAHTTVLSFANPPGSAVDPIDCPDASCGNFAACVGSSAISFYQIKASNFDPNKMLTHRYMIFAHYAHCTPSTCGTSACADAGGALGMCGSIPANTTGLTRESGTTLFGTDFIVSLGGVGLSDGSGTDDPVLATQFKDELDRFQAGTFMHELGHTLELNHGGALAPIGGCTPNVQNDYNFKPNYISVMNYSFQSGFYFADSPGSITPILPDPVYAQSTAGAWQVDYSSSIIPSLNENNLDETVGLQAGSNVISIAYDSSGTPFLIPGTGPVDWNQSGTITSGVVADVNADHLFTTLAGFDDWSNLQLAFQCRPPPP